MVAGAAFRMGDMGGASLGDVWDDLCHGFVLCCTRPATTLSRWRYLESVKEGAMTQNPTTNGDDLDVPVSPKNLEECRDSAYFWVNALPEYADRNQSRADFWSILAGVLAAITSLSIFPLLGQGSGILDKTIVSAVALLSAVSALVPRVKNYGEMAGTARVLAAQYGSVYGRLLDVVESGAKNQHAAKVVVAEFDSIKAKKDALRLLRPWIRKRKHEKEQKERERAEAEAYYAHLHAGEHTGHT
jgi:hypothetical protein